MENTKLKTYIIYYFTGDYWSGEGEKRHYCSLKAHSESEAERIFKQNYPNRNFGWVDEYVKKEK